MKDLPLGVSNQSEVASSGHHQILTFFVHIHLIDWGPNIHGSAQKAAHI